MLKNFPANLCKGKSLHSKIKTPLPMTFGRGNSRSVRKKRYKYGENRYISKAEQTQKYFKYSFFPIAEEIIIRFFRRLLTVRVFSREDMSNNNIMVVLSKPANI